LEVALEVGDDALQGARFGQEIGVEDGDEFPVCALEAVLQGAAFVALPVRSPDVLNVHATGTRASDSAADDLGGDIVGVVQDLDLQAVSGIIERSDGRNQAFGDEAFVVDRELDGDSGPVKARLGLYHRGRFVTQSADESQVEGVKSVDGQPNGDDQVKDLKDNQFSHLV
jgi:hypothetical protein